MGLDFSGAPLFLPFSLLSLLLGPSTELFTDPAELDLDLRLDLDRDRELDLDFEIDFLDCADLDLDLEELDFRDTGDLDLLELNFLDARDDREELLLLLLEPELADRLRDLGLEPGDLLEVDLDPSSSSSSLIRLNNMSTSLSLSSSSSMFLIL